MDFKHSYFGSNLVNRRGTIAVRFFPALLAASLMLVLILGGCVGSGISVLPSRHEVVREQLVLHSDFELPQQHRLIDDLVIRRSEISNLLGVGVGNEPIHVYLFDTERKFRDYVTKMHPDFPDRRALFVKRDEELKIFAVWNPRVGEDLRHEVTHGYLHSAVRGLPLWLDEGIAEFFEVERGQRGLNTSHLFLLNSELAAGRWTPDLLHLEKLTDPASMSQIEYAESWLWAHFLLTNPDSHRKPIIQAHLQQLMENGEAFPISAAIDREFSDPNAILLQHLKLQNSSRLAKAKR